MRKKWYGLAAIIVAVNMVWLGMMAQGAISHDAIVIGLNAAKVWEQPHPYPLFLLIPAGMAWVTGDLLAGVQASPVVYGAIYMTGIFTLCRVLRFSPKRTAIACILASFPVFPPYKLALATAYVAAFYPWYAAMLIYTVRAKGYKAAALVVVFAAVSPFLHLQLAMALFITLLVLAVAYRKDRRALAVVAVSVIAIVALGGMWAYTWNWLRVPADFISGNASGWWGGHAYDGEYLVRAIAKTWNDYTTVGVMAIGYFALYRTIFSGEGKDMRVLMACLAIFAFLHALYPIRAVQEGREIALRMSMFVFPLAAVVYSDVLARLGVKQEIDKEGSKEW